ncbi:Uncharacterised protein [Candidatus Ornithobacterium hominis]|uniref:hypothetical protein n=1 Tax=Candidatus Ornithobacterium hominis TaxID=2497989 RepID=UPI000E5B6606|nr:hypothetical protein [Candidatus Ornithobacterium hominis]SZD73866.1 Uncharacterised protein [Candidatus Ornithobacterium hominis]
MKNKSKIQGDGNVNIQDISKSKISVGDKIETESKMNKLWIIIPVIIALIGLIVQILIGWEQLINWFYAK